jgi:hypothetical protein
MMEFLVEVSKNIYEISELVTSVSWTDKLNDGCSKLVFSYVDDDLKLSNGDIVRFKYDNDNIFYGAVFKHGRNKKNEITATAYDQLRYAKAKDTIVCRNDTVTTLGKKMCNYFNLRNGILTDTKYKLPVSVQDDKTWLDIIYQAISDTLMNTGRWYSLRDEFGSVAIRDLDDLKLDLVLGDESLCYDYDYKKSIDDNFYNLIKLVSDNETTGKRDVYITKDSKSISRYGLLQYFEVLDKNDNPSQAKSKADMLLKLFNREEERLTLNCLGDTRIRAGNSFYTHMEDVGLTAKENKRLIVRSVTHNFLPIHTMDLEVAL